MGLMIEEYISYGFYIKKFVCTLCSWKDPGSLKPYTICPACGEDLKEVVGRYKTIYKIVQGLFGAKRKQELSTEFIEGKQND